MDYEVENDEYIFAAPDFEPGFYVVRCNHGPATTQRYFKVHPFESGEALAHFNDSKTALCHDTSRGWTELEILEEYGHQGKHYIALFRSWPSCADKTLFLQWSEMRSRRRRSRIFRTA